jgi:uncharacterized membrane protein
MTSDLIDPDPAPAPAPARSAGRFVAIDLMRGFVMLLMIVDHSSVFFNTGRVSDDSAASWKVGSMLPLGQFLTRFMTHLCAPTFLFLAGTSIAISVARRGTDKVSSSRVDRDLLIRGAFIVGLDVFYMSTLAQHRIFQVLYAIGASMMLMVVVRRLPDVAIVTLACGWFLLGEWVTAAVWSPPASSSFVAALTIASYSDSHTWVLYPFVPWLCLMSLGFAFGRRILLAPGALERAPGMLVRLSVAALGIFLLVRSVNGYGNMFLPRDDLSLAQWLHVSKYPPALAYASLELGILGLCLAFLLRLEARGLRIHRNHPVLVFGQTALFFYVVHFTLLGITRQVFGVGRGSLPRVYAIAAIALVLIYPACVGFRALKARYPRSLLRFV